MTRLRITFKDSTSIDVELDDEKAAKLIEGFDPTRYRHISLADDRLFIRTDEVRSIHRPPGG